MQRAHMRLRTAKWASGLWPQGLSSCGGEAILLSMQPRGCNDAIACGQASLRGATANVAPTRILRVGKAASASTATALMSLQHIWQRSHVLAEQGH